MRRILLSIPHMGGKEERYVREAFASNWLSTVGPNITAFEQEFEARSGFLRSRLVAVLPRFTWVCDSSTSDPATKSFVHAHLRRELQSDSLPRSRASLSR